ncbi:ubiquitin family protein, putative (macronuclear) [Tetrahymena thermophila SB210]|uniref:Ubiquitin family protein, putative n=1 Tax=Tetrahymena thermophila (strain SB210) TaxID=312017 RepID=Q22XX2_TETTS|nr:ubiquitin family protein, putative [Tetrahymena thermophila SB210]EAR90252.1 ubiquitin family protein, putative [Tetrahymena thermophila SB210]|eukprot:XP_001010497.1 ubiquitin family protein, putative [Tetrahymena thermophila SB210]
MVDQVNRQEPYVENSFEVKCSKHIRWNYIYIHLQEDSQDVLKCQDCIIEEQLSTENLIQIYKILESKENTIFKNWPPFESSKKKQLYEDICKETNKNNGIDILQAQLESYFKDLQERVIEKIQSTFKKLASQMNEVILSESQILNIYNQVSQKEELKNVISSFTQNKQEKINLLQNIITNKIKQTNVNTEIFINAIHDLQVNKPVFSLKTAQTIKQRVLNMIDLIEVYEAYPQIQLDLTNSNSRQQSIQLFQRTVDDKVKIIIDLIANKSNFCSNEFISEIEQTLKENKFIFQNLSFDNIYLQGCYPIDFSLLKDTQIQDLGLLKDVICSSEQKYQSHQLPLNKLSQDMQPISFQILQFIQKNSSFSQVYQQQFENLLLKYPIFDEIVEDPMQVIPLKFELSERENKQHANIIQNDFKSWVFQLNQNAYCQAYIPFTIDNNLKYIARIRCQSQRQDHIWVGLVPAQDRNTLLIYEQNVISFRYNSKTYNKVKEVVKGKSLHTFSHIEELEIHFCVKDKYFACTDFSNYQNLNKTSQEYSQLFDTNKEYNLAFLMYHQNSRIQLTFFQAVDQFPVI